MDGKLKDLNLEIEYLPVDALKPYERNARRHKKADVDAIAASITELGFDDPVGIWGPDNVIVEGHGRMLAAKKLGMERVPCIRLDHLSDEGRRAYALAHNRTAELSGWDNAMTRDELSALWGKFDMKSFGFGTSAADFFEKQNHGGDDTEGESEEYAGFVDKFKPKKTTDDCYTPANIYDAVAGWVAEEYGEDRSRFVRPFYPGGDYKAEKYPEGCVVVDNPPFSILAEIMRFYTEKGIRFFLFAPTLTLFSGRGLDVCYLCTYTQVTYENGATVNTSFVTNLDREYRVRTAPELCRLVKETNEENLRAMHKELPNYAYPDEVVTAAMMGKWSRYGVDFRVPVNECVRISEMDAQKECGKAIFGGGFLLSERAAAERAAAERAAAERAAAERATAERAAAERAAAHRWELSEREREIVRKLSENQRQEAG